MKYAWTARSDRSVDIAILLLRLMIGTFLFVHGAQKLFGWFGGKGLDAALAGQGKIGIPAWLTYLSVLVEAFGSLGLLFGIFTRCFGIAVFINMMVAFATHIPKGIMTGEDAMALGVIALAIVIMGPGRWSVDRMLFKQEKARP